MIYHDALIIVTSADIDSLQYCRVFTVFRSKWDNCNVFYSILKVTVKMFPSPPLQANVGKTSTCHTERRMINPTLLTRVTFLSIKTLYTYTAIYHKWI